MHTIGNASNRFSGIICRATTLVDIYNQHEYYVDYRQTSKQ